MSGRAPIKILANASSIPKGEFIIKYKENIRTL